MALEDSMQAAFWVKEAKSKKSINKKRTIPGAIYETSGRAREYRELACNLYVGCDHACRYCYVPVMRKGKAGMRDGGVARKNILAKVIS